MLCVDTLDVAHLAYDNFHFADEFCSSENYLKIFKGMVCNP